MLLGANASVEPPRTGSYVALMSLVVIPREERYLEARFSSEYLPYKASVRRWI
jgi:protein-S-isoprenylcysteine O-methyltransferase Ste14